MKLLIITLFVTLSLTHKVVSVEDTGNYAVQGVGSKSCFAFNSVTVNYANSGTVTPEEESLLSKLKFWEKTEKTEKTAVTFDDYKSYMKGFMTAYNVFTEKTFSITGSMKEAEVVEWLNNYCKDNPMMSVETALTSFALDHHDSRMKTSNRRVGR